MVLSTNYRLSGEQFGSATGALSGKEAYGAGIGGSQLGYGLPGYGALSGTQAGSLGLGAQAGQFGSLASKEAAGVNAKLAASDEASALEAAAAQAKAAQAQAAVRLTLMSWHRYTLLNMIT